MELRRDLTDGASADPAVFPKQCGLAVAHCHQSGSDEEGTFLYRELEFKDAPGSVSSCWCGGQFMLVRLYQSQRKRRAGPACLFPRLLCLSESRFLYHMEVDPSLVELFQVFFCVLSSNKISWTQTSNEMPQLLLYTLNISGLLTMFFKC
jgi:hypothetical protein